MMIKWILEEYFIKLQTDVNKSAEGRVQWRAFVDTAMNFLIS